MAILVCNVIVSALNDRNSIDQRLVDNFVHYKLGSGKFNTNDNNLVYLLDAVGVNDSAVRMYQ